MAAKYDNATKSTWRGWAWNQVAKRVKPGSVVLCLAGDSGLDAAVAEKKGLVGIGVDTNKNCVEAFRKNGGIAVCDDIHNQLFALKPDAVILDFMGGITPKTRSIIRDCFWGTKCIVVNLLRGRDSIGVIRRHYGVSEKHRGKHAAWFVAGEMLRHLYETATTADDILLIEEICDSAALCEDVAQSFIDNYMSAAFYSYKSKDSSSHIYYDSVAISNPGTPWGMVCNNTKSKRKAAAAKALLTMRKNLLQK